MSAAKHTPAPWGVDWNHGSVYVETLLGNDDSICEVHKRGSAIERVANARLIAAAPELLDALKTFVAEYVQLVASGDAGNWDAEDEDKVKAARAAIAKAEVQS